MEETRPPTESTTTSAVVDHINITRQENQNTAISRAKKDCLSFMVSLRQGFEYVKASILGQAKKLTARNEREATEADLRAAKMQVEAADAAEDAKARLHKSA